MKVFRFDREVTSDIDAHGSVGASQVKFGHSTGEAHLHVVYLDADGVLGEHEAPTPQLFVVVEGRGWASGRDGQQHGIKAGDAVFWDQGEMHASGTDTGMTAVVMQALELNIVAPPY